MRPRNARTAIPKAIMILMSSLSSGSGVGEGVGTLVVLGALLIFMGLKKIIFIGSFSKSW